jgi:hypothetical protein
MLGKIRQDIGKIVDSSFLMQAVTYEYQTIQEKK